MTIPLEEGTLSFRKPASPASQSETLRCFSGSLASRVLKAEVPGGKPRAVSQSASKREESKSDFSGLLVLCSIQPPGAGGLVCQIS